MALNDGLPVPWRWLVESQLLALLALGFLVGAQRVPDKYFGWLLSSCVALGLAIAAFYNFITAAGARAIPAAGVVVFVSILLFAARRATHPRARRSPDGQDDTCRFSTRRSNEAAGVPDEILNRAACPRSRAPRG